MKKLDKEQKKKVKLLGQWNDVLGKLIFTEDDLNSDPKRISKFFKKIKTVYETIEKLEKELGL